MIWKTTVHIGTQRVKNRIVFPPVSTNWAHEDGTVSRRLLDFYTAIARGGCGMIVISGTAVAPEARGSRFSLGLWESSQVAGFKDLTRAIAAQDCFAALQIMHVGGQGNPAFTGCPPVSPSARTCKATGHAARALDAREIEAIRDRFVQSALLAREAGFKAVELHLAHGYLLHEFITKAFNHRTDRYGGPLKNRLRLVCDIINAIRAQAPDLIIGTRISGDDYCRGGITEDVSRLYLPVLEQDGVGYFSVTAGTYETSAIKHRMMAEGRFFGYARAIRGFVGKPVIGVGKVLDLASAEAHLAGGDCDLVAIGRAMVADPHMIAKFGKGEPGSPCLECGQCQYLRNGRQELSCPQWKAADGL